MVLTHSGAHYNLRDIITIGMRLENRDDCGCYLGWTCLNHPSSNHVDYSKANRDLQMEDDRRYGAIALDVFPCPPIAQGEFWVNRFFDLRAEKKGKIALSVRLRRKEVQ